MEPKMQQQPNQMHPQSLLQPFLLLTFVFLLSLIHPSSSANFTPYQNCYPAPYKCGGLSINISYPFLITNGDRPRYCSYPGYNISCVDNNQTMAISVAGKEYQVKAIDYSSRQLTLVDRNFAGQTCPQEYDNTTGLAQAGLFDFTADDLNLTLYINCTAFSAANINSISCLSEQNGQSSFYWLGQGSQPDPECSSTSTVAVNRTAIERAVNQTMSFGDALGEGFSARWTAGSGWCDGCTGSGGLCGYNRDAQDDHTCICRDGTFANGSCSAKSKSDKRKKIAIVVSAAGAGLIAVFFLVLFLYKRKKRQQHSTSSTLLYRSTSSELSSKKDPELGNISGINYQTHIFSYDELQEATNAFDASRELGDGGFGTVYKGKLRDGRIVAVKRLYESNYKRVEQFMNEVVILSRLRHQNLVTLYGCTSRHSRELLLVYEFVPNGTVADHLHGSRASEGGLTWPVRMSIAIETADALAYLHAVEPQIIHRDVKTNNILLDNSFHVKVADFGLSRLFPLDATHVSTAPQGTPGYVDPEYHQCYQLTDKSDVYSFGVVLMELISSMPAVDITRHRHEINLATMAMNKIQNQELDKFVDHELGYHSDVEVKRMITQVAELAFRCLQMDREMRPNIKEVLEELRGIEIGDAAKPEKVGDADVPTKEESRLLKNFPPYSPDSVADRWGSMSTTPNTSG